MFDEYLTPKIPWEDYGIAGLSIIHIGQVIPSLTLARQIRQRYPHIHIVVGGSVFNRHADLLDDKQELFKEFFHSLIVSEGELPLDQLVCHLKDGKTLNTVAIFQLRRNPERTVHHLTGNYPGEYCLTSL